MSLFPIIIITLLLLIKLTYSSTHSIIKLTDNSFDSKVTPNSNKKWFIVFYVDTCSYCEQMLRVLEKDVIPNYDNDNSIGFGSVDCNKNIWLSLRFNITHVPYSILLDESKQYMYEFKAYSTAELINEFIESDKQEKDRIIIPKPYSYVQAIKTIIVELYFSFKETIEELLKSIGIYVNVSHFILIPFLTLMLLLVIKVQKMILNVIQNVLSKTKSTIKNRYDNNKKRK